MIFFEILLCFIGVPFWVSEMPKTEARLVPNELNTGNIVFIEIENIGDNSLQLETIITLFFDDSSYEDHPLKLSEEELFLPPFTPTKVSFQISKTNEIQKIKFQLKDHGKMKVKLIKNYWDEKYI